MRGKSKKRSKKNDLHIILHNVRSSHNVGSVLRTADAVGVARVFLTGYTPAPVDRFGRPRGDVTKTSLGAEHSVEWEQVASPSGLMERLRKEGISLVSVEQSEYSIDYREYRIKGPTCFVFGNEVRGLSGALLKRSNAVIDLPMCGVKESLNVSVSVGIVLYHFRFGRP